MAGVSEFTISPKEAMILVKKQSKEDDGKKCYMMQITFTNVYSDSEVPNSCFRILPRLLNGVPLGAGLMSRDQLQTVRWKFIEGTKHSHTFISQPLLKDEAQETKRGLRDRLIQQSQRIFGDLTVKANIVLSECINYDGDMILNDIAVPNEDGFHFRD
ncbi:hypothetical protein LOTGIDRAFT_238371 [Lottia gigantea]|uniref:Uncharacterized protein n=1 Tax=Lottia gigantea TaxID=225164 RepID=V4AUX6_LOTGI|nr:hypothetical protein LOTGIDRAFT_238371 [Lottia gigantea]ESP01098.1 hypothetical protein LOTGIDRAFT_238371 [Lottia gigantea]